MKDMTLQYVFGGVYKDANTQTITVNTAVSSTQLAKQALYRFCSSVACHIRQGSAATSQDASVAASTYVPANTVMYFGVRGDSDYLSVIKATDASAGIATLTRIEAGF